MISSRSSDMRVLSIGADRSQSGMNVRGSSSYVRQKAYAEALGALDIVNYTLREDRFETIEDGPLRIVPANAPLRILYGPYAFFRARRLPRPDVVTAQDPHLAGIIALLLARRYRVPLHIQVHTDVLSTSYGPFTPLNYLRQRIALFVLRRADRIRVVSLRIKQSIEQRFATKPITVLPIFVDIEQFAHADAGDLAARFSKFSPKLLFVGRLEPEKNACLALRAFAAAAPESACLIVLGEGSERGTLESLARELGVASRVFFEGAHAVAAYYALADLVLVTSHYEGYGLVIVEALASGTPVLATDVGIAREAGAIVASDRSYADALRAWISSGARTGQLTGYPYASFEAYVRQYCDDIAASLAG
jgi:glycosyltransferase involved in cell wall biosynthesis